MARQEVQAEVSVVPDASSPQAQVNSMVASFVTTLLNLSECLETASPRVGPPFAARISRMRSRMAFSPSAETTAATVEDLTRELQDFASCAVYYKEEREEAMQHRLEALEQVIYGLARRVDFYANRLRHFATQMETAEYPTDPEQLSEMVALQAAGLRSSLDSLNLETASFAARARAEKAKLTEALNDLHIIDESTGMFNRNTMLRYIEARRDAGHAITLLLFEFDGEFGEEVIRMAAQKLLTQFRHRDRIARWSDHQFLVLFEGPSTLAETRAAQVVPWVSGTYTLEDGSTVQVHADFRALPQPESVPSEASSNAGSESGVEESAVETGIES
jgi:GGDEF domain-containing protein